MRNNKFIIGFLVFDIVAVLIIVLVLVIAKPFESKKAPEITTSATTGEVTTSKRTNTALPDNGDLDQDAMQIYSEMPALLGMREESEKTEDGLYYTAFRAELDMDFDGDGSIESISVSLDDHSESFYVLVNKEGNVKDYVVPGLEFTYQEKYEAKACKGGLRGFSIDLDSSDPYTEVAIEMSRDNWEETQTLVVRYDGSNIHTSVIRGYINGVNNKGEVQFSFYDALYGVHKLYRTYRITSDTDLLVAKTNYFFCDSDVERSSYLYNPNFDLSCMTLGGEDAIISAGSTFYWVRSDNETYVDVIASDGGMYRLPIEAVVVEYESGPQTIYRLGDHNAADIGTR